MGSNPVFRSCDIVANNARGDDASGGGGVALISGASAQFFDSVISKNVATLSGGGILISGTGSNPSFNNCSIQENRAILGMNSPCRLDCLPVWQPLIPNCRL